MFFSRVMVRALITVAWAITMTNLAGAQVGNWSSRDELIDFLLGVDSAETARLDNLRQIGLMTMDPAVIPYGSDLYGDNWDLRHPIAAGDGQNIVLIFVRSPYHSANVPTDHHPDAYTSQHVMVRSSDGGQTWSQQVDMRQFFSTPDYPSIMGMKALTCLGEGQFLYIGEMGSMTSSDGGATWIHHPNAFGAALPSGVIGANMGPNIIAHPQFGLVAAAHAWRNDGSFFDETWFWISGNGGVSWQLYRSPTTTPSKNIESAMALIGDKIAMVARSHDPENYDAATQTYHYSQLLATNRLALTSQFTNIPTSDASQELAAPLAAQGYAPSKAAAFGYWSQDTVDLILNPITNRLEAVVTNRVGRAADNAGDVRRQSLSLWSIDPAAFADGSTDWRYEGTLFERHMIDAPLFVDGMHPAGSVIDLENQVQHIFIYVGYYMGPAGIFQITRSLHTDRLSPVLLNAPGDADGDGQVNLGDLQILGDHWQAGDATWAMGDFNVDGQVNLADLQILGDHWAEGAVGDMSFEQALGMAGPFVPEPANLGSALAAVLLMLRR
ncbi:MAG: hypothetical protein IT445_03665 [Phycisphaeraceae bacterium]|nr:hypothetical protein [Phycisphaeraceae bacterium]